MDLKSTNEKKEHNKKFLLIIITISVLLVILIVILLSIRINDNKEYGQLETILNIDDKLTDAIQSEMSQNENYTTEDIINAMNNEIDGIKKEDLKIEAELRKVYLLTESQLYEEAQHELNIIEQKYDNIETNCEFNIRRYNIYYYLNGQETENPYNQFVSQYCNITGDYL